MCSAKYGSSSLSLPLRTLLTYEDCSSNASKKSTPSVSLLFAAKTSKAVSTISPKKANSILTSSPLIWSPKPDSIKSSRFSSISNVDWAAACKSLTSSTLSEAEPWRA